MAKVKQLLKPKIERSTGIPIVIGGVFYGSCGNGYEGKTKELDNVVMKEAMILADLFGKDIEIRFNSDRESGGAWIKNNDGSSQVGLSAGLRTVFPNNMGYFEFLKANGIDDFLPQDWETRKKKEELLEKLPKRIGIETYIEIDVLKDGKLEQYPENEDAKDYWRFEDSISMNHDSLEKAVQWLEENVNPQKIKTTKTPDRPVKAKI